MEVIGALGRNVEERLANVENGAGLRLSSAVRCYERRLGFGADEDRWESTAARESASKATSYTFCIKLRYTFV